LRRKYHRSSANSKPDSLSILVGGSLIEGSRLRRHLQIDCFPVGFVGVLALILLRWRQERLEFLRIQTGAAHYIVMDAKQVARKMICELHAKKEQVERSLAKVYAKLPGHIDDHDLDRYHLGMVTDEAELAPLEEHLLCCPVCVDRAQATASYVDAIRAAACGHADTAQPDPCTDF